MRKGLLGKGQKVILVAKWQRISLLWKTEFVNDEIEYLSEEISKQSIEGQTWFLLTTFSKM